MQAGDTSYLMYVQMMMFIMACYSLYVYVEKAGEMEQFLIFVDIPAAVAVNWTHCIKGRWS